MSGPATGQIGGGLTGGMFSAAAQNPLLQGTDLSKATIAGVMPGAQSYSPGGQMPEGQQGGNPLGGGINMQNLPALLRQGSTMTGGGGMGGLGGGGRGMQDISQGMQAGASLISMLSMLGVL